MKKTIILIALFLGGCGAYQQIKVRGDIAESKKAYKECLVQHASNSQACDSKKIAYEADLKDADSLAIKGDEFNNNVTVNGK